MSANAAVARPRTAILAFVGDAALITVFAAVGRSSHARAETLLGLFQTAWPFLAGLALLWLALRAWRRPLDILRTGIPLWIGVVAVGMLLRLVTGAGTALAFVIVATVTLGVFLLGWRGIAALVRKLSSRRSR